MVTLDEEDEDYSWDVSGLLAAPRPPAMQQVDTALSILASYTSCRCICSLCSAVLLYATPDVRCTCVVVNAAWCFLADADAAAAADKRARAQVTG